MNFVVRIKQATHLEILEEIAVREEEKAVGIQRHAWVRMIELLQFYVQGMVSEKELIIGLKARAREADLARESSRKRYLAKNKPPENRMKASQATLCPPGNGSFSVLGSQGHPRAILRRNTMQRTESFDKTTMPKKNSQTARKGETEVVYDRRYRFNPR